jgi:glucoamylase
MKKNFSPPSLLLALALLSPFIATQAQNTSPDNNLAPGAPGHDAQWTNAGKDAVGTSNTPDSKVWFTLRDGVMTEVYYPTVDVANTRVLQFVVVSADGKRVETEEEDTTHHIEVVDPRSLTLRQINTSKNGDYSITKTYITDPARPTVLIDVEFNARHGEQLYVYYDPSLNNSGMHDSAWTQWAQQGGVDALSSDADKASALVISRQPKQLSGFGMVANGFFETSDFLTELRRGDEQLQIYPRAADGNVVQLARVLPHYHPADPSRPFDNPEPSGNHFTLALGFGKEPDEALKNARQSLLKGFGEARAEYEQGWHDYVDSLRRVDKMYEAQFEMAAMVLKAHEDKTYRGAMIASLSIPWGGGSNANEPNVGGYHLVWSRDLYQVASAFYALGDKASADRALDYLFRVQQKPDGSFPQNSWLDGRPFWGSLQMDEVAYPLVLAYQLGRTDNETFVKHVRPAADFIVRHGPFTPQERWEEKSGYSPSTVAAEIAGLVCASEVARRNNDEVSAAIYLAAADDFARNVERWTATTTGVYGDKNYYLRLSFDDDPNDGEPFNVGNGGGTFDEREIVDAGFLELVRLGVKSPQDPLVAKSVAVVDKVIKVDTPNGADWYRYNHDGYGEMDDGRPWNFDGKYTGKGRLWALLAGERGEYELARGEKSEAVRRLDAMTGFANDGRMMPEQVWDSPVSPRPDLKFGEGTGSATPLAWAMAQFIRLAANLQEGRNLDTPDIVAARYAKATAPPPRASADFSFPAREILERMQAGTSFRVAGDVRPAGSRVFLLAGDERRELKPDAQGNVSFDVGVARGDSSVVLAVVSPSGATYFQRANVSGLTSDEKEQADRELYPPDSFERVKSAQVSPRVEGEYATFVYRGRAKRVEVVGDFTGWSPAGLVLRDVPGSDAKLIRLKFPKSARLEYKFIADGEWTLDPLNTKKNDNGVGGENSNFTMPDYKTAEGENEKGFPLPSSMTAKELEKKLSEEGPQIIGDRFNSLVLDEVQSKILNGTRKITVLLPRGYKNEGGERYPVLYLQDGTAYQQLAQAGAVANRLMAEGKVRPFIIILIDPVDRNKEYWANDQFADFMAQELVPYIDTHYRTIKDREARALLGASLGGTISVWTWLRHPDVFARVGGQSSALQIDEERVVSALAELDDGARARYPTRFYFDAGQFEPLILDLGRRINVMLRAKGYPVTYRESPVGHNYTAWRDRLAETYAALWAK